MASTPTLPRRAVMHDLDANLQNENVNMRGGGWLTILILSVLGLLATIGLVRWLLF